MQNCLVVYHRQGAVWLHHDEDIQPLGKLLLTYPVRFADSPPNAVSHHRIAAPFADGHHNARGGIITATEYARRQWPVMAVHPYIKRPLDIDFGPQPLRSSQSQRGSDIAVRLWQTPRHNISTVCGDCQSISSCQKHRTHATSQNFASPAASPHYAIAGVGCNCVWSPACGSG